MTEIRLELDLDAPVEGVFEAMADHARYDRFRPIGSSELLKEGTTDRNGVGAVRRLKAWPLRFDEEVTAYESPSRLDYLIIDINGPVEHEGGSIRFEPTASGTHVLWTSTFRVTIPLLGGLLGVAFAFLLKCSFTQMLEDSARLANAPADLVAEPA